MGLARVAGMCVLAWSATQAAGQLHMTDVAMKVENGRITTGRIEAGAPVFPHQVFTSELGIFGIPGATFDPGYDSQTGAFPANTPVGITVRRALRRWDGFGFDVIPPERLEIVRSQSITTPATDPDNCGVADSLQLGLTTSTGRLHQHPGYQLLEPASQGVYLLELEAWFGSPTQGISEPFYILFSQFESQAVLEEAAAWVEGMLARSCYANCTRATAPPLLNVDDFTCFIDKFAQGDCYANCTGNTTPPILTVDDFTCFIDRFAQGCP